MQIHSSVASYESGQTNLCEHDQAVFRPATHPQVLDFQSDCMTISCCCAEQSRWHHLAPGHVVTIRRSATRFRSEEREGFRSPFIPFQSRIELGVQTDPQPIPSTNIPPLPPLQCQQKTNLRKRPRPCLTCLDDQERERLRYPSNPFRVAVELDLQTDPQAISPNVKPLSAPPPPGQRPLTPRKRPPTCLTCFEDQERECLRFPTVPFRVPIELDRLTHERAIGPYIKLPPPPPPQIPRRRQALPLKALLADGLPPVRPRPAFPAPTQPQEASKVSSLSESEMGGIVGNGHVY